MYGRMLTVVAIVIVAMALMQPSVKGVEYTVGYESEFTLQATGNALTDDEGNALFDKEGNALKFDSFTAVPKVFLMFDEEQKGKLKTVTKRIKVLTSNKDLKANPLTEISCIWTVKLEPGTYDGLYVIPKVRSYKYDAAKGKYKPSKVAPIKISSVFTVTGPLVSGIDPDYGEGESTVTLTGTYFGSKKGKVYLVYEQEKNGKKQLKKVNLKVLEWTVDEDGKATVKAILPPDKKLTKLPTDFAPVAVENKVGPDYTAFTIGNSAYSFGIILDSSIPRNGTSSVSSFVIAGTVMNFGDHEGDYFPAELQSALTSETSSGDQALKALSLSPKTVTQTSMVDVDSDGSFTTTVALVEGPNEIKVSLPYTDVAETVSVYYNPDYEFSGFLMFSPDVAYVDKSNAITATVSLTDAATNPDDVKLYQVAADGTETFVAQMYDNGNLANGDEIDSDGTYSCIFYVTPTETGSLSYRVSVGLTTGTNPAKSETVDLLVGKEVSEEEINMITTAQSDWQTKLNNASLVVGNDGTNLKAVSATVQDILDELANNADVADYGVSDSGLGIWIIWNNGIPGMVGLPPAGKKGAARKRIANPNQAVGPLLANATVNAAAPSSYNHFYSNNQSAKTRLSSFLAGNLNAETKNLVKSNKAFVIAAQYFDWGEGDDIPKIKKLLEDNSCFDVTYKTYTTDGSGNVADFKSLSSYGIVCISSHGDSYYSGAANNWKSKFGWNGAGGIVVLHSNEKIVAKNLLANLTDVLKGRLVVWGDYFGMTPNFITYYNGKMPNSLVYVSICRGTWNATMANAFINSGAGTYFGYDDYVNVSFTQTTGTTLFNKMLEADKTAKDGYDAVSPKIDPDIGGTDNAVFKMYGSNTLSIEISGLQNGDFESGNIKQSWTVSGDGRIIPQLGAAKPTGGKYMAIISTGLGFTTQTGSISQTFCTSSEDTVSFQWNFFSEEFPEYVGSIYQDAFIVTLTDAADASNTVTIYSGTIDSIYASPGVSDVAVTFDQGGVMATGWQSLTFAIPDTLKGKKVTLKFYTTDVGDSIYDSAVLIDDIKVYKASSVVAGP